METFLFDKIVFGPVKSRRLGISLGINVLPVDSKVCNFDCIYCECGLTLSEMSNVILPTREEIAHALEVKLSEMKQNGDVLDVITFAGNGEPTIHPAFPGIISDTIQIRNKYFPVTPVSVLSNATMLSDPEVVIALKKVNQNILKLDSGIASTIKILNRPSPDFKLENLVMRLKQFEGKLIIQTMFIRGTIGDQSVDNTTMEELQYWEAIINEVRPQQVMIYTIQRNTPYEGLQKVTLNELRVIASRLEKNGIKVQVSA